MRLDEPEDLQALFDERAAIRQFDGGFSRQEAEALAREDVKQWLEWNR